jgi:hypothetical protein
VFLRIVAALMRLVIDGTSGPRHTGRVAVAQPS